MKSRLIILCVLFLSASFARATVIRRLTLAEVERDASEIFVGTVRMTTAVEGPAPRKLIYTEVTFENLDVIKGKIPAATTSYRFAGGEIGERRVEVHGMPRFEVGGRYLVFADAKRDPFCPAIGWHQGRYTVKTDPESRIEQLADSDGRPVYSFTGGQPVTTPPSEDAEPLTLDAGLEIVRELMKKRQVAEAEADADSRGDLFEKTPPEEEK
jgi:hypothetical protein